MNMKCKECGSLDTIVTPASEIESKLGEEDLQKKKGTLISSAMPWEKILDLLTNLLKYATEHEKNKRMILVCKKCGHWERL